MTSLSGMGLGLVTLLSTSIEGVLYGISLMLFGGTIWMLTHGRPKDEINWSMVLVAIILTIISTIHMVVDTYRLIDGFVIKAETFPGGPAGFFADVTQRTFIMKSAVYVLQTLLADGVMVYRCCVVWEYLKVILLPVGLWCSTAATSAVLLYRSTYASSTDANGLFLPTQFYLLTMTTHTLSSALLAHRISKTNQNEPGSSVRIISHFGLEAILLSRTLIDATVLYTLMLFVLLIFQTFQNTGGFVFLDAMTPIISITFYMVPVRIGAARCGSIRAATPALSPICFAVVPSPSQTTPTRTARRSSI